MPRPLQGWSAVWIVLCGLLGPRSFRITQCKFRHRFQLAEMHNPFKAQLGLSALAGHFSDLVMLLPVWVSLQPPCQAMSC